MSRTPPHVIETSPDVFVSNTPIVEYSAREVAFLLSKARRSPKRRARLCAHTSPADKVHEMLIVLMRQSYIRPHKHVAKTESFHMIKGRMDVIVFDDKGKILKVIKMGDARSGRTILYRLNRAYFHTLIIKTPYVAFHEVTNGPFKPSVTSRYATWAPEEGDPVGARRYGRQLASAIRRHA